MFSGQSRDATSHDSVSRTVISKRLTVVWKEKRKKKILITTDGMLNPWLHETRADGTRKSKHCF